MLEVHRVIQWVVRKTFADFQLWRVDLRTTMTPVFDGHKNSKQNMYRA